MNKELLMAVFGKIVPYYKELLANINSPHNLFEHKLQNYDQKFLFIALSIAALFSEILMQIFTPAGGLFLGLKCLPGIPLGYFFLWLASFFMETNKDREKILRGYTIWGTFILPSMALAISVQFSLNWLLGALLYYALLLMAGIYLHKYYTFKFFKGKLGKVVIALIVIFSLIGVASSLVLNKVGSSVKDISNSFGINSSAKIVEKKKSFFWKNDSEAESEFVNAEQKRAELGEVFKFRYLKKNEKESTSGVFVIAIVEPKKGEKSDNNASSEAKLEYRLANESGELLLQCPAEGFLMPMFCIDGEALLERQTQNLSAEESANRKSATEAFYTLTNAPALVHGTAAVLDTFSVLLKTQKNESQLDTLKPKVVTYKVDEAMLRGFSSKNKNTGAPEETLVAINRRYSIPALYVKWGSENNFLEIEMISYTKP